MADDIRSASGCTLLWTDILSAWKYVPLDEEKGREYDGICHRFACGTFTPFCFAKEGILGSTDIHGNISNDRLDPLGKAVCKG